MSSPATFSPLAAIMYIAFLFMQVTAVTLMPKTAGFTNPPWTGAVLVLFTGSMWILASLIHRGLPLGIALPLSSAIVPLAIIFMGILFNGEVHTLPKLFLLCLACAMVGAAGLMK